ncbi:B4GALT3 [Cordylochernes scorpioides]|uniref:B4GALT3 n=1 Tax=Cordylochernes scorpioides TaxID=51811 RepID=A0ABY6KF46_9ARAC|nr:B4GALT3 [Cordylochernes scorpioides]
MNEISRGGITSALKRIEEVRVRNSEMAISRWHPTWSRYTMMPHKKAEPNPDRWDQMERTKMEGHHQDGLNHLSYDVLQVTFHPLYTQIIVDVDPLPRFLTLDQKHQRLDVSTENLSLYRNAKVSTQEGKGCAIRWESYDYCFVSGHNFPNENGPSFTKALLLNTR